MLRRSLHDVEKTRELLPSKRPLVPTPETQQLFWDCPSGCLEVDKFGDNFLCRNRIGRCCCAKINSFCSDHCSLDRTVPSMSANRRQCSHMAREQSAGRSLGTILPFFCTPFTRSLPIRHPWNKPRQARIGEVGAIMYPVLLLSLAAVVWWWRLAKVHMN